MKRKDYCTDCFYNNDGMCFLCCGKPPEDAKCYGKVKDVSEVNSLRW